MRPRNEQYPTAESPEAKTLMLSAGLPAQHNVNTVENEL